MYVREYLVAQRGQEATEEELTKTAVRSVAKSAIGLCKKTNPAKDSIREREDGRREKNGVNNKEIKEEKEKERASKNNCDHWQTYSINRMDTGRSA